MYPDVMAYIRGNYSYEHPQAKTSYERIYDEEDMDVRKVPYCVRDELYEREKNLEYVKALKSLQSIFEDLVKDYREGWVVSLNGTVACNYAIKPFGEDEPTTSKNMQDDADENSIMFKVVEHFIALQKLPVGEPIPKEITEFIEQCNALKLLEG